MRKLIRSGLCAILMAGAAWAAWGQSKKIVAAADPYPPFVDPSNPKEGLSLEVAREAFKTQGYEVEFKLVPWARAEAGLGTGDYDILPDAWSTEARRKTQRFSVAYAQNDVKFIKKKGDPFEYKGLASLKGKSVGTVRDYNYGDAFQNDPGFKREAIDSLAANVDKLLLGRIDLTLEDEIVARSVLSRKDPKLLEKIEFTENPLSSNSLYITTGMSNPRGQEIMDAVNKGLAAIKKNGTYARILKSYGVPAGK